MLDTDWASTVATVLQARQTILPKRLTEPGPNEDQLRQILEAAASAPDHGQLLPWRFVLVPKAARAALAETFATALMERDPQAGVEQLQQARDKAYRAPCLMLVVVDALRGDPEVDLHERIVSAGCAVQNVLLMATALGFGSALTSGKALKSVALRALFDLHAQEHALCFVSVGTVQSRRHPRLRPSPRDYCTNLAVGSGR